MGRQFLISPTESQCHTSSQFLPNYHHNSSKQHLYEGQHYYIAETLKLIKETDNYPLYIYCMIKTLLTKKDLLNNTQIKEISQILNIAPEVKEVIKYKEKIVYKERKPKVYTDDY